MKCITCKADIPPAWVNAINKNECPGCGGVIMDDSAKELLTQLREAMAKMPNDAEGLAGWLMSTYDLFPKGTIEPTTFHRKPTQGQIQEMTEDGQQLRWANAGTNTAINDFRKRSGADKVMKDPKLAAIANAINNINSIDGQMYGAPPEPEQSEYSLEEQQANEQQQYAAMAAKAKAQGRKLTMKEVLTNNAVDFNMGGEDRPLSEAETEMVKHLVGGPESDEESEMEAIQSLPPMLQNERFKRLAAQRELKFGGSSGLIKRSGS